MKSLVEHTSDANYQLYLEAIRLHESDQLNEFLSTITGKLKQYYDFIKELAAKVNVGVNEITNLLKTKGVFTFFTRVGFSIKRLFALVRTGFQHYRQLHSAIAEFVASTKVVRWTSDVMKQLDAFLAKHPPLKRMTGVAVGAILLYIWLNMSFTGDFKYDFDQSTLINALLGNYSLSSIFAGPEGVKLLTLFVTGSLFSFPWPGPQAALFVFSVLYGLSRTFNVRDVAQKLLAARRTISN
jgi:hypothetical protein